MIPHPIIYHPFEFSLGPITLTGFGIAMMLAFGMAHWVSQEVLEARGDDPVVMNDVTFAALIGTIVGGKVYYAILMGSVSALWGRAGFVFWGGFIGAVLACALVIRWRRQPFLRIADGAAVGIAAGYAIGRTGCWARRGAGRGETARAPTRDDRDVRQALPRRVAQIAVLIVVHHPQQKRALIPASAKVLRHQQRPDRFAGLGIDDRDADLAEPPRRQVIAMSRRGLNTPRPVPPIDGKTRVPVRHRIHVRKDVFPHKRGVLVSR